MIIIGIVLLGVGLLVSLLAFRGRVAARGVYCRKCRFDLAGLEIEADGAKCPECGSEVFLESARRGLIRRRSRVGLAAAAILMLAGSGGIWVGAAGKTGSMIAAMPDPVVLWLTDFGVDEALDELVVRVSKVPGTMSAKSWDDAIEQGLAFQADTALVWDVRWGEVLYQGLALGQMSDEQVGQYFMNAYEVELTVRDRVHPGDDGFGYLIAWERGRFRMTTGGILPYQFDPRVVAYGVVGEEPVWERDSGNRRGGRTVWLYPHSTDKTSMLTSTWQMKSYFDRAPGQSVDVFFEYEIAVLPMSDDDPIFVERVRKEIAIQIIDRDKPIVPIYSDEEAVKLLLENLRIGSVRIKYELDEAKEYSFTSILLANFRNEIELAPYALEVSLLLDGREIRVGELFDFSSVNMIRSLQWNVGPWDKKAFAQGVEIHARLVEEETVTLIFRTKPELVSRDPRFERVLDVRFVFADVPIKFLDGSEEFSDGIWEEADIRADLLDD
jgi:hypothetical protein